MILQKIIFLPPQKTLNVCANNKIIKIKIISLNFDKKNLENKNLPYDDYLIDIDDRNLKNISINSLEDYLNIELKLKKRYVRSLNVAYYDSKDNLMVQVSDFFSNLYFSYLKNKNQYQDLIDELTKENYIKDIYYYPENQ